MSSSYSPYSSYSSYSEDSSPPPFSPASSVSAMSTTESVSSDSSPVPSPASPQQQDDPTLGNYNPRYRNIYEERLQPLPTYQTLPPSQPLPKATHRSDYNPALQTRFLAAVERGSFQELDSLLSSNSELVNINQFNSEGQTPLQHFCSLGNLKLVQLMVRFGADTRMTNRDGWSPIHIASYSGNSDVMMYIMRCSKR